MPQCCKEKTVGGVVYKLIDEGDTRNFGCKTNCIFEKKGLPGERFCFKEGHLKVVCNDIGNTEFAVPLISCGKANNDTEKRYEVAAKKQLKIAHFNITDNGAPPDGYDAAHIFSQSDIANFIAHCLDKDSGVIHKKELWDLIQTLFTFDDQAWLWDPDQTYFTTIQYFSTIPDGLPDYIHRNNAEVTKVNQDTLKDAQKAFELLKIQYTEEAHIQLLATACWAPANLRYGNQTINTLIGEYLDPMGNEVGLFTAQEGKYKSTFGASDWKQRNQCNLPRFEMPSPCRPSSTGGCDSCYFVGCYSSSC